MKRKFTIVLALSLLVLSGSESWAAMYIEGAFVPSDYETLETAWDPGANTASFRPLPVGPGGATFSIMAAGLGSAYPAYAHGATLTSSITALDVSGYAIADYEADLSSALDVWAAASLFTNLGLFTDGGANAAAPQASGGHLGDIRVAAWGITTPRVLAHAYQPGIEGMFLGGTIGGDVHFDVKQNWVNDPEASKLIDFYTVALHELGHSLGLGHSDVSGSVMWPSYSGALRTLQADDIAGIQAIYGVPVPGALLLGILGLSVAGWKLRKFA